MNHENLDQMDRGGTQGRLASLIAFGLGIVLSGAAVGADVDEGMVKDLHITQVDMAIAPPSVNPSGGNSEDGSGFSVHATVDKNDRKYKIGETVQLAVQATEDAYLWVFDTGTSGKVHRIFPNQFDQENFLPAGETLRIPGTNADYDFRVSAPSGRELLTVIATTSDEPLATHLVEQAVPFGGPFLALSGNAASVAKDLSIALREEHPTWQRDVVIINIE